MNATSFCPILLCHPKNALKENLPFFGKNPLIFWKIQEASLEFLDFWKFSGVWTVPILRTALAATHRHGELYTINYGNNLQTRQTCMSTSLPTVGWHPDSPLGAPAVFHVAPCLRAFYFVATVSNSAVRARRENMTVF